jgi:histone-lysine N-methyltransferase SETMAR
VLKIIKVVLEFSLKCAKWIPRVLTKEHKRKRKNAARENIFLHNLDPDFFEDPIVTVDETWVHHYTPETKRESQQWLPALAPRPQKAIRKLSANKVLATVFWDNKGVLLVDFLKKGRTITGEYYAKLLEKLLRRIRRKRENLEEEGIFLLQDNATPHTSKISTAAISRLGFIPLTHPPYSPDLAPSDY